MKRNMFINELSLSSLIVYENLVFLISIFYGKKCDVLIKIWQTFEVFIFKIWYFLKINYMGIPFNLLVY